METIRREKDKYSDHKLCSDNIIYVDIKPHQKLTLEMCRTAINTIRKMSKGVRHPILVDARKIDAITIECQEYLTSQEPLRYIRGCAVILNQKNFQIAQQNSGNLIMGLFDAFTGSSSSYSFFLKVEEGKDWIFSKYSA